MYKNIYKTFVQSCFVLMPFILLGQYSWSTTTLPTKREGIAAAYANGKVVYAGGFYPSTTSILESDKVDIYDTATGTWTTETLPIPHTGMVAMVVGDKIVFAGGSSNQNITTKMHIYNTTTGTWVHKDMPDNRPKIAAAVVGDRIYFGGGGWGNLYFNDQVMVYNVVTDTWEPNIVMTEKREYCAMASAGTKVIFAFGNSSDATPPALKNIEIYDTATKTWQKVSNTQWREEIQTVTVGNKSYFIGGTAAGFTPSKVVNIYDATTDTWSNKNMAIIQQYPGIGVLNNRIFIGGGADGSFNKLSTVEVLNTVTNTYEAQINLSLARAYTIAVSTPTQVFFAGGVYDESATTVKTTDLVDILAATSGTFTPIEFGSLTIAPTLANDQIQISVDEIGESGTTTIEVVDMQGRAMSVQTEQYDADHWALQTSELQKGIYIVKLTQAQKCWSGRFVKID